MPDKIKLLSAINAYSDQAYGSDVDGGELATERSLSLDAYAGKNLEPAPDGRSQVVDWTVFETVQWILPSLCRIFAGGSQVVEFEPTGEEDEQAAEQESEYLNHMVQRNNWFMTFLTWCQDALITKNAYCLAYMEEKLFPETEKYEGQSQEQVALLLDDEVEVVGQNQYNDPNDEGTLIHPVLGEPVQDEAQALEAMTIYTAEGIEPALQFKQLFDLEIKRVTAKKRLRFRVLAPERVKVAQDTPDFTLDECNFLEFWDITTISDLRKEGFDVDDDIPSDDFRQTQEDSARDENLESSMDMDIPDPTMRQVKARYVWIRHDYDGDGIAELQYVVVVGNTVLFREEVSRIPVACIVPFIHTHRHIGMSISDLVFDVGRIKTAILRGGLDSLYLSVNPRHQISNKVSIDDMLVSTPGALVRIEDDGLPGEGHIMPLQTEFVLPQAQAGLQYMDQVTESRAGVTKQFQGLDTSANNDYNRIGQLSTMASQRVELIARIIANGVERLFGLAHELIVRSGHQGEALKLRGTWVDIDPSQWRTGRDMRMVAPFAAGNKDSLLQRLMMISTIHEKALAGGLPIVDPKNAYNLALEIAAAADVAGNKFFTDPDTVQPPPPAPDYTAEALRIEDEKVQVQAANVQTDAEVDKYKADLDAQVKQYQVEANSQLQLALAQIKAGSSVDLEKVRANLKVNPIELDGEQIAVSDAFSATKDANEAMTVDALKEVIRQQNGPKRVVRDKAGKVVGVEPA
jgi:hypothetical protein